MIKFDTAAKNVLYLFSICLISCNGFSQGLAEKANDFLNSLTPKLKAEAFAPFENERRTTFHYVPMDRPGPTFHDFDVKQKDAALALLKASLSQHGYEKTTDIMQLENILYMIENNTTESPVGKNYRDPLNYHFTVFGQPSDTGNWGWKIEGHHVSYSFTSAAGKIISSTPSFMGSNPAIVPISAQKGMEVLKEETDLGFTLINSFSPDQLKKARFSEKAPQEIMTGNQRKAEGLSPMGIMYSEMNESQQKTFTDLINVFLSNYEEHFAKDFKTKIENAGWDKVSFAWAGALKPGIGNYYRIQSPVFLIEYDNTQNNANHVHTVVRDLTNDFGEDLLKEHYDHDHQKQ